MKNQKGFKKGEEIMKFSECNARQKKAYANICYAAKFIIGGLENTMLDYPAGSSEYEEAKAQLSDHEALVNEVYQESISCVFDVGYCDFSNSANSFLKDVRFCGKDWLMARCEARVRKCGY